MTNENGRDRDPLGQAESIFDDSRRGKDQAFSVELPVKTASHLSSKLFSKHRIKLDVFKGTDEGYSSGVIHEENMLEMLLIKMKKAVPMVKKGVLPLDKISVSLSEREIDFLNELLLEDIQLDRELGRLDKEGEKLFPESYTLERIRSMQESTLRMLASTVSALRELNMAFIKAGGNSRPEIRQFFEG